MKLEAGKQYIRRDLDITPTITPTNSNPFPFKASGRFYMENGNKRTDGEWSLDDIVAEATIINEGNSFFAARNIALLCQQEDPADYIWSVFYSRPHEGQQDVFVALAQFTIDIMSGKINLNRIGKKTSDANPNECPPLTDRGKYRSRYSHRM